MPNNLMYNSYGQKYQVSRARVSSLNGLQKGDHCALHRCGAYWHHFIVEYIDHKAGEIHAIEYSNTPKGFCTDNCIPPKECEIAKVVRKIYKFQDEDVYLFKHDNCLDPDDVVSKAQKKVGKGNYNPFTNNCEHFAMWCKTGTSSSDQINKAKEMLKNPSPLKTMASIAGAVLANQNVKKGGGEGVKITVHKVSRKVFTQVFTQTVSNAGTGQKVVKKTVRIMVSRKYKTWTPGPWTPSVDWVHGPGPSKYGPGPWTPFSWTGSMDPLFLQVEVAP